MTQKVIIGVGIGGYSFNAAAKTITITGITTVTTKQILLIVNNTRDKIIYNPTQLGLGGTVTSNVLTLEFNTTAQLNTDELAIHFALNSITDPLPIPITGSLIGAATETTLTAINTKLPSGLTVTGSRLQVELPVGGSGLTNTEIRATALPVSLVSTTITGSVAVTGGLTDTQIRATPLPISGSVNISNLNPAIETGLAKDATLTGGTAKAILRTATKGTAVSADVTSTNVDVNTQALDVSVKGSVTVTGGLTDTQIRATALPVSGTVSANATLSAETTKVIGTVNVAGTVPISGALTDAQIRATPLPVSGSITSNIGTTNGLSLDSTLTSGTQKSVVRGGSKGTTVAADVTSTIVDVNTQALDVSIKGTVNTGGLTNTELRATTLPVSLSSTTITGSVAVTGALTDTQIRATPLPVSGAFFQTTQPVSGTVTANTGLAQPLTDTQLRATALPISGTVVTGGLTDTQIRATPLPISGTIANTGFNVTGNSLVSTANSTAVALAANGVFTGTSEDISEFSTVMIMVFSDQTSMIDGLSIQQSSNGTNWDLIDAYTIPINSGKTFSTGVQARFFRIVYTNGATASTVLRLQTIYNKNAKKNSSIRPQDSRANDNDFEESLSFLMGHNSATNAWDRLRSTIANGLQVDVTRMPSPSITYSSVANGIVPATAATDLVTIYGSATKTINILNVWVTGVQTTAGQAQILLIKRSTANTAGTSTAQTRIPYDSNDVAATATVLAYTANPTLGTAIGNVRGDRAFLPGAAAAVDAQGLAWGFMNGKPMTLRGVAQGIAINLNGATLAGGSINVTIEWVEI